MAVSPRKSTKKVTAKKVVKKTTSAKSTRKATKKVVAPTDEAVKVPAHMSIRAQEKAHLLTENLDEYLRTSALYMSYISGACFILVGVALLGFSTHNANINQLATTISSATGSTEQIISTSEPLTDVTTGDGIVESNLTAPQEPVLLPPPEFQMRTLLPDTLNTELAVTFIARNTKSFEVFLRNITTGKKTSQSYNKIDADTFKTVIRGDELESGTYQMVVILRDLNDGTQHSFTTKKFEVPEPIVATEVVDTTDTTDYGVELISDPVIESDTTVTLDETSVVVPTVEAVDELDVTEDSTAVEKVQTPTLSDLRTQFVLKEPTVTTFSGQTTLIIQAPTQFTVIQLYARPTNGLRAQFVARAIKGTDRWYVHFDSNNIPNGEYQFFAVSSYNNQSVESNNIKRIVRNLVAKTETTPTTENTKTVYPNVSNPEQEVATAPVPSESEPVSKIQEPIIRDFIDTSFEPTTVDDEVVKETDELLARSNTTLTELLRRYAIAVQSGDATVIRLAEEALEKKRQELALSSLQDKNTTDIADNIDSELSIKINDAKDRVVRFEQLRAERTAGDAGIDTDQDGITDIDERLLYNTDPLSADSDNDGISDGVEIVGGFNPTNPTPEAVVQYESPKETLGVVREDVLVIEAVEPAVEHSETQAVELTSAIIRGRGLPNSIVTLHIFSAPTVVTVRTDADGSFEYTFEKELADGTHDVYVAMTDNTGRIVAQSNPFSFVKEAQAFTPVDAATPEPVVSVTAPASEQSYSLVIGLSVLSFGLILLMLGTTLRRHPALTQNQPAEHIIAS